MGLTYTGEIRDGVVIFEGAAPPLPTGTRVRVHVESIMLEEGAESEEDEIVARTRALLLQWARAAEATAPTMPVDLALEHDHYARGKP